ncbi:Hsp20 family protein [Vibrio sp. TRT 17S01]|uniref:Hsp20 family protein n=1 Tax=Vibrio sp. TRT 17S01 TaxID=3418505 RepID=UPI003CEC4686
MSLIPRDSWADFYRLFDNAFPAIRPRHDMDSFSPRVDVLEKETAFEIIADLPGVAKEDISITYQRGVLTLEACTNKQIESSDNNRVIHKERYEGKMIRSFTLGENLLWEDIYAEYQEGVLVIVVPKPDHVIEEPNRIEIN